MVLASMLALVALAGAAPANAPADARPGSSSPPEWVKKPTPDQMRAVWPAHAFREGLRGAAKVNCAVNLDGLLEDCHVISESPPAEGFGDAALLLTPSFVFRPARNAQGPVRVRATIPIAFQTPPPSGLQRGGRDIANEDTFITRPSWLAAPGFDDLARAYPARGGGADGRVVLRCGFYVSGKVKDCETLSEEPADVGFATAARALAGRFRLEVAPELVKAGVPVYVNLPIRLPNPKDVFFETRHVGQPTWIAGPDPVQMLKLYPPEAAAKGVTTGLGMAQCVVGTDGALRNCTPLAGRPDGLGFSEAAVRITSVLRMSLWTDEGGPVIGATVRLPVRFKLASGADATPPAPAAATPDSRLTDSGVMDWEARPSPGDIAAAYPVAAKAKAISGGADLDCRVDDLGHLTACRVTAEDPPGAGFGKAALMLAPTFTLKKATRNGQPVAGGVVHLPIRFAPAERP